MADNIVKQITQRQVLLCILSTEITNNTKNIMSNFLDDLSLHQDLGKNKQKITLN